MLRKTDRPREGKELFDLRVWQEYIYMFNWAVSKSRWEAQLAFLIIRVLQRRNNVSLGKSGQKASPVLKWSLISLWKGLCNAVACGAGFRHQQYSEGSIKINDYFSLLEARSVHLCVNLSLGLSLCHLKFSGVLLEDWQCFPSLVKHSYQPECHNRGIQRGPAWAVAARVNAHTDTDSLWNRSRYFGKLGDCWQRWKIFLSPFQITGIFYDSNPVSGWVATEMEFATLIWLDNVSFQSSISKYLGKSFIPCEFPFSYTYTMNQRPIFHYFSWRKCPNMVVFEMWVKYKQWKVCFDGHFF